MQLKRYLITGGPGTGKSTLTQALKDAGFKTFEEGARALIRLNIGSSSDALPWKNRDAFDRHLYKIMVEDYKRAPEDRICFYDGGLIDILAWRKYLKKDISPFEHVLKDYPYEKVVFSPEPSQQIYISDNERPMDFKTAKAINKSIISFYKNIGYEVIILSKKQTVLERTNTILKGIELS